MKLKNIIFIFAIILCFSLNAQETKKALFLGNSYTYYNNLPNLIDNIAQTNGDTLVYDSNTPGGYTLEGHSTNSTSLNKINSNNWDFVVLQEQSQRPSFSPSQVAVEVKPFAVSLNNTIKANNECTKTMFFMTWGRENGDAANCAFYTPLCTYEGMQQRLRESYLEMTIENNADCSPVGVAWKNVRALYPSIDLYSPDESHPNENGSYLAACVFYSSMFYKTSVGNSYWYTLDSLTAFQIQTVTSATVLDSLNVWSIETLPTNFESMDSSLFDCDSIEINGNWFTSSTNFSDTIISGSCSNIINYNIDIGSETIDSIITACDSIAINGNYFTNDTSFIDTSFFGSCTVIISYQIEISPSVHIDGFNQIMILKTIENGFIFDIIAYNFDTITIYNSDTIVYQFTSNPFFTNSYNCENNSTDQIELILEAKNKCSIDSLSHIFYCNGWGSIQKIENYKWEIFPNPANDYLTIHSKENINFSVCLLDITGKIIVRNKKSVSKLLKLNVSEIEKGLYFVIIYNEKGIAIGKKKVIIN